MSYISCPLTIAMLSLHSSPLGELGTRDTGGMSVYIRELAAALGRRGHFIDIFTQQPGGMDSVISLGQNVRLVHVRASSEEFVDKTNLFAHLPALCNGVDAFRRSEDRIYHLIHSHYWLSGMAGILLQKQWQCGHITMFHTLGAVKNATRFSEKEPVQRIQGEQALVRKCQRIIAPTEGEKAALIYHYDAPPDAVSVIPCGVNLSLFKPENQSDARMKLGCPTNIPLMLFVGRCVPVKGLGGLLRAMALLKKVFPRICLMVAGGDDPQSPEMLEKKKQVREFQLTENVQFIGRIPQTDLPRYYCAADVTVFPSHYESFGLTPPESLACGTPVAATPVGCIPDVIQDGENGWICPDARPETLARMIRKTLQHQQQNRFSPEKIRQSVAEYGWERVAIRTETAYKAVVERYA